MLFILLLHISYGPCLLCPLHTFCFFWEEHRINVHNISYGLWGKIQIGVSCFTTIRLSFLKVWKLKLKFKKSPFFWVNIFTYSWSLFILSLNYYILIKQSVKIFLIFYCYNSCYNTSSNWIFFKLLINLVTSWNSFYSTFFFSTLVTCHHGVQPWRCTGKQGTSLCLMELPVWLWRQNKKTNKQTN